MELGGIFHLNHLSANENKSMGPAVPLRHRECLTGFRICQFNKFGVGDSYFYRLTLKPYDPTTKKKRNLLSSVKVSGHSAGLSKQFANLGIN